VDATQKTTVALTAVKKKRESRGKKVAEKKPSLDVKKGFFFSGKKSELGSAFGGSIPFIEGAPAKKKSLKKKTVPPVVEKKQKEKSVPHVTKPQVQSERRTSVSWFSQIPDTLPARMRIVAYVGVVYIVLGVWGVSYALADMYGVKKISDALSLDTVLQKASVIESALLGTQDTAPVLTTTPVTQATDEAPPAAPNPTSVVSPEQEESIKREAYQNEVLRRASSTAISAPSVASDASSSTTEPLSPPVTISFSEKAPFHGTVTLSVSVANAEKIEFALLPKNALTPYYLGRAYKVPEEKSLWRFSWETKNIPNGTYALVAQVKNKYGMYMSEKKSVSILHPVTSALDTAKTEERKPSVEVAEAVTTIETEMPSALRTPNTPPTKVLPVEPREKELLESREPQLTVIKEDDTATEERSTEPNTVASDKVVRNQDILDMQRSAFKDELLLRIERFGVAYRAKDVHSQEFIQKEMTALKEENVARLGERGTLSKESQDLLEKEFASLIKQEVVRIETREKMITERVGDTVSKDSDNDGIVDYDEVTLYKTDPTVADSDNDGFTDGAEVMSGYDPINSDGEVMVAFENPESEGLVREDILTVASIDTERAEEKVVGARLAGKGLPNSFITLYVFSTPVVITVRTNEDGSWSYIFDKELEDGAHTVYVGITDNAGRIVAKSKPFGFVKTAEAFAAQPEDGAPVALTESEPELLSTSVMLLVAALVLTMLGSALVALGMYFMRPQEYEVSPKFV